MKHKIDAEAELIKILLEELRKAEEIGRIEGNEPVIFTFHAVIPDKNNQNRKKK